MTTTENAREDLHTAIGSLADSSTGLEADILEFGHKMPAAELIESVQQIVLAAKNAEFRAVQAARTMGMTWQEVGDLYGVTKQAAQQRWADDAWIAAPLSL